MTTPSQAKGGGNPWKVWQDREIHFDLPMAELMPRAGEVEIDSINAVEDTKGNNGERGSLSVTNLRLIWVASKRARINLSIGLDCILSSSVKAVNSRLRGRTQALYVMTQYGSSRFEFIFTSLVAGSPRLFTSFQAVSRAYQTSKLYRDLKLRGAILRDGRLVQLPDEEVCSHVQGVWNLSSDQGHLGSFYLTSVRVVWYANLAENFNVSVPYVQIRAVHLRDSKFGPALVLESGDNVLGFRIDPPERLRTVFKEISALFDVHRRHPNFGVRYRLDEVPPNSLEALRVARQEDDVEIVDTLATRTDALAAASASLYAADGGATAASSGSGRRGEDAGGADPGGDDGGGASRVAGGGADSASADAAAKPVYCAQLGLAIEALPDGVTIDDLWGTH